MHYITHDPVQTSNPRSTIIYTDLDGTLLDDSYSFDAALPALQSIRKKGIPLVLCSSKTRAEIEFYRTRLGNHQPFISENGGGIFIPKGYFAPTAYGTLVSLSEEKEYLVVQLGARYADLRRVVQELRNEGFAIKGFGDMTIEEVAASTGLNRKEAEMAKEREFDEPFVLGVGSKTVKELFDAVRMKGFSAIEGRWFHHLLGSSDKGKAIGILSGLFTRQIGTITTLGIGDGPNDIPMLQKVDLPVIVQKPDGTYDDRIQIPGLVKARGSGPVGWNDFVENWLSKTHVY